MPFFVVAVSIDIWLCTSGYCTDSYCYPNCQSTQPQGNVTALDSWGLILHRSQLCYEFPLQLLLIHVLLTFWLRSGWLSTSQLCFPLWYFLGIHLQEVVSWECDDCGRYYGRAFTVSGGVISSLASYTGVVVVGCAWWQDRWRWCAHVAENPTDVRSMGWIQYHRLWWHPSSWAGSCICLKVSLPKVPFILSCEQEQAHESFYLRQLL